MSNIPERLDSPAGEQSGPRMPVLFIGHGNPMNAIEDNVFSQAWLELGRTLPRPRAILCISAHWETAGPRVTAMEHPRTIHDFYGFPEPLYRVHYPAPGDPDLARLIRDAAPEAGIQLDSAWGLDHGAWSVLCRMFPGAAIPVVQLSLDRAREPELHYRLGRALHPLREQGVLIVGSGNIVHNLGALVWEDTAFDWAVAFDERLRDLIRAGDHEQIIHYQRLGPGAALAVPTNEHFLPLLYTLALQDDADAVDFFCERVTLGAISMRGIRIG